MMMMMMMISGKRILMKGRITGGVAGFFSGGNVM